MDSLLGALGHPVPGFLSPSPAQPGPAQAQPDNALSLSSHKPMRHSGRRSMMTGDGWNLP